jgi:hypothetical protein
MKPTLQTVPHVFKHWIWKVKLYCLRRWLSFRYDKQISFKEAERQITNARFKRISKDMKKVKLIIPNEITYRHYVNKSSKTKVKTKSTETPNL